MKFKLSKYAKRPVRGSDKSAGYDIHTLDNYLLEAGERRLFKTGVFLAELEEDSYIRLEPRSKLANKYGINVLGGVIDCDYRGEICVILHNTGDYFYEFKVGEAIAQFTVVKIKHPEMTIVEEVEETERGSSGINCKDMRKGVLEEPEEDLCLFCTKNYNTCKSKRELSKTVPMKVISCSERIEPF